MELIDIPKNLEIKPMPEKMTIPEESQKKMLEFFMRTSIPRRKAKMDTLLPENENGSCFKLKQKFM